MILLRKTLVLMLVMVVVLLAAGCAEQMAQGTQTVTITSAIPTIALTDKELAEKSVADAKEQIQEADMEINWFKGNVSTRDDQQLPAIIAKREVAVSYVSTAQDDIKNGDYTRAREKAEDAYAKANESYTDAVKRENNIIPQCPPVKLTLPMVIESLLLCIPPSLTATLLHVLMKILSLPFFGKVYRKIDQVPAHHIFLFMWVVFSVFFLSGKLALSESSRNIATILGTLWVGLILAVEFFSLIIFGLVMFRTVLFLASRRTSVFTYGDDVMDLSRQRIRNTIYVILLSVLITLMPLVFIGALLISNRLCM